MKKRVFIASCILGIIPLLTGCGNKKAEQENSQVIIAQNDWSGGFGRLAKIQQDVMSSISILDSHNYEIVKGSPEDYWNNEDYHYLHFVPVYSDMLSDTLVLNEKEEFAIIQQNFASYAGAKGMNNPNVQRIDKHHYILEYDGSLYHPGKFENSYGYRSIECIYDAAHDWLQAVSTIDFDYSGMGKEDSFYEFADLGNGEYAFQTQQERLFVTYEKGIIKEFYYSVLPDVTKAVLAKRDAQEKEKMKSSLSGSKQPETTESVPPDEDTAQMKELVSTAGSIGITYNSKDNSIFLNLDACSKEWVMEAVHLKSMITYENNTLSVSVLNKLTKKMENFSVKNSSLESAETR